MNELDGWTELQKAKVIELYGKKCRNNDIAEFIGKSCEDVKKIIKIYLADNPDASRREKVTKSKSEIVKPERRKFSYDDLKFYSHHDNSEKNTPCSDKVVLRVDLSSGIDSTMVIGSKLPDLYTTAKQESCSKSVKRLVSRG